MCVALLLDEHQSEPQISPLSGIGNMPNLDLESATAGNQRGDILLLDLQVRFDQNPKPSGRLLNELNRAFRFVDSQDCDIAALQPHAE